VRTILSLVILSLAAGLPLPVCAEDWPEWRGPGRRGVWNETGILEKFPEGGLEAVWRVSAERGYSGPAVANGRVYFTEFSPAEENRGVERAVCLDENTGETLWKREWPADYAGLEYSLGPRATPTVDEDHVYVLGAVGDLLCLRADSGEVLWRVNFREDFGARLPMWGFAGAPLAVGGRLIAVAGGRPDAKVVALDKLTGRESWRALEGETEPGYAPPFLAETGGAPQVIIWTPQAVSSLDPATGRIHWSQPFQVNNGLAVATPVLSRHGLLISSFYNGSRMYQLNSNHPGVELRWKGNSDSEIETDGLHSLVTTPVVDGDYIYGICSYGQFRCLDARTGERVWETMDVTKENARWASGQIVRNGDRYFINNDRGELIIAKLSPAGYEEISRTQLMEPTQPTARRRERNAVHWTHPAYANRHVVIRNDQEIVRFSLEAR
jgi:outer membrane protein assembly factor BamB